MDSCRYLDYLRTIEIRIPRTDYGSDKYKPFFGILFETDDLYYITQVSHPQKRHEKMNEQRDFYKLFNPQNPKELIAVVNLNYMFPIPKNCTYNFQKNNIQLYRTFKSDEEKSRYIDLLNKELEAINKLNLDEKAKYIYNLKYNKPYNNISKRCVDFKDLEKYAKLYKK